MVTYLIQINISIYQVIDDRYTENMATFRIHQDQENRRPNAKQTQKDLHQQQRRAVLGALNENTTRIPPHQFKQVR